ncbi:hypothetical protein HFN89_00155 [Rhizobium laguerreae]|nr:hypothetical protein [Rhizobium laguerreae]
MWLLDAILLRHFAERRRGNLPPLLETRAALEAKIASVPDCTGQWDRKDYFADEQEDFNRAVDAFAETTKALNEQ